MTLDFTKPITTRDGRPVRILCTDGPHPDYPVIGFIAGSKVTLAWALNGTHSLECPNLPSDLINPPVKRRGWVVLFKHNDWMVYGKIYGTEAEAKDHLGYGCVNDIVVQLPEWCEPT